MRKLWFCVENKGSFDVNLATVVGFTTKRNDSSKVGKYGSGLKYSIPFLIRNKIDFKLFVNGQEVVFGTEVIDGYHNGELHQTQIVTVNGKPTSLSIDSGPEWENWFVVREILQNGLDEEEFAFDYTSEIALREDYTQWYLDAFVFAPILQSFDEYFSFKRNPIQVIEMSATDHPVWSYDHPVTVKVFKKHDDDKPGTIYYRGFRVGQISKSLFDYDLSYCQINEYRLMTSEYDVKRVISYAVQSFGSKELISMFLGSPKSADDAIWYTTPGNMTAIKNFVKESPARFVSPFSKFAETMKDPESIFDMSTIVLPFDTIRHLSVDGVIEGNKAVNDMIYQPAVLSAYACERLNAALRWFDEQDFVIINCTVVRFEEQNNRITLGTVNMKTGEIFLSIDLFDNPSYSDDLLLQTIYEEWAHFQYKAHDETRKFQDALIGDIIALRKRQHPFYSVNN